MPVKVPPPEIVSLIAAGEVIESPASVLKELLENALDAGADSINIDVKKAGKELIRINDNGSGMSEEDLQMSVLRHATSKITSYEDLHRLSSYGFRGEALYSVFAVSRLKISSWNGKSGAGTILTGEGGDLSGLKLSPAPPVKGSTVEICDLFFNTPVRMKFLKKDASLKASLIRVVEDFALARPQTSFAFKLDGREIFNFPGGRDAGAVLDFRVRKILAGKTSEKLIKLSSERDGIKFSALISDPVNLIASRTSQYTFVNGRSVENRILQQAVYKAYEHLRNGRHPAWIIFLETPGDRVDVNIHPQKREIKFSDENFVFEFVHRTVSEGLLKKQSPPSLSAGNTAPSSATQGAAVPDLDFVSEKSNNLSTYNQEDFLDHVYKNEDAPLWHNPPITFVGQLFDSLLLFQTRKSLLLVDQHAAVERIMFEKYAEDFNKNMIQVQALLLPVSVEMSPAQAENILRWKDWLKKAGFEINRSGPGAVTVYSTPSVFYFTPDALSDFLSYLSEILGNPDKVPEELKRDSIATLACKKSIKARDKITKDSALKIIEDLKDCADSLHCPHGRPTILELTLDELVRKFGRTSI